MPVQLKVKEMMIPIDDYAVTTADKPLKEAVPELMKIYCQVETGKCTEAGHRTSLVLDAQGKLVGILDFQSILKVLIPEIAGGISGKLQALGLQSLLQKPMPMTWTMQNTDSDPESDRTRKPMLEM